MAYILLERKCISDYTSVGSNVMMPMPYSIFNMTAYALVLLGTFSLQEVI